MMRIVWASLGFVSLAMGIIGIALPLLPTVPFLLLAAWCFGKSSERLHQWLLNHPRFGPSIRDWQQHGAVSPRAKKMASISMLAVLLLSAVMGVRPIILLVQATVLCCVAWFLWTRPSA